MSIYYVSHSMNVPQTRYQRSKKLVLTFFIILKKLEHYFHAFPIIVLSEHFLRSIVKDPKATRRISEWASKLRSYGLRYEPRTTIKGQVLVDFIAHFTSRTTEHADQLEGWILNVDGSSNSKGQASELSSPPRKDPS